MTHNALHGYIFAVCLCLQHVAFALYEHHESICRFALQHDGGAVGVLKILERFDALVKLFFCEGAESGGWDLAAPVLGQVAVHARGAGRLAVRGATRTGRRIGRRAV